MTGPDPSDARILERLIALELELAISWDAAAKSGLLDRRLSRLVRFVRDQKAQHINEFDEELDDLGGRRPAPVTASEVPEIRGVTTRTELLDGLISLEGRALEGYLLALTGLDDAELRGRVAAAMAAGAQHLIVLRRARGQETLRYALEKGQQRPVSPRRASP